MTVVHLGNESYQCLSTDTKPTNVPVGTIVFETDTRNSFEYNGTSYDLINPTPVRTGYIIYIAGSNYKAINTSTGATITNTTPDVGALTQSCVNALSNGGYIGYTDNAFTVQSVVTIPNASSGSAKTFNFVGVRGNNRTTGTVFLIGSSFPNQRYMFEGITTNGSGQTVGMTLKNVGLFNPTYARSGTSLQNISTGSTIIDAGLAKIDSDNNVGIPVMFENINTQYLWRGIHLIGYLYWPVIRNYINFDQNTNVVSDTHIIMEKGTHVDYPKGGDFQNIILNTLAGTSGGTGSFNNAIVFGGGYHNARKIFVDGGKYNKSVFGFLQCFTSTFNGMGSIDLNATQGASFKGTFLLDSNDFSGNAPVHTPGEYATYNNQIYDIYGSPLPYSIYYDNGAFRNKIRAYGYWGGTLAINDTNAGIENVVEVIEGQAPVATAMAKAITTSSLVKIVDQRSGANAKGIKTSSGDGTTKVFTQAHGLWSTSTPLNYYVYPLTSDAAGAFTVTVDTTNITITYNFAPPSGSSNLKWAWFADLYPS